MKTRSKEEMAAYQKARRHAMKAACHTPVTTVSGPCPHCAAKDQEIARLTANLAQYESIKRFALLDRDFTFDGGELTYTLKLKRREIERRYADVIEQIYAEPSPAHA